MAGQIRAQTGQLRTLHAFRPGRCERPRTSQNPSGQAGFRTQAGRRQSGGPEMNAPIGFESSDHPVLAIEDLTVSFDGFKAVDSLNLYVQRNEVSVVIGPNG